MDVSFQFDVPWPTGVGPRTRRVMFPVLRQFVQLRQLQRLYHEAQHLSGLEFVAAVLAYLKINVEVDPAEMRRVPPTGAFIALANHPTGLLDGLVLLHLLGQVRPEMRAVANELLAPLLTHLGEQMVLVKPDAANRQHNVAGLRRLLRLVHNDIPLLLFPAGAVAHRPFPFRAVAEGIWHPTAGRLVLASRVPVLPVWLSGQNRPSFNWLGTIYPLLRTLRLPAELLHKQGTTVHVRIGVPLKANELHRLPAESLLPFLRARVLALGVTTPAADPVAALPSAPPVITETPVATLEAELTALPAKRQILVVGHWEVYVAKSREIPAILREIGRLRELTFRREGEGTQLPSDLDRYDTYYRHLFLYDRRAHLLVGAYRMGHGRSILRQHGRRGFYLHTLFKLQKGIQPLLSQSLELGRAFIREEYQRQPLPLLLLWKGIAAYLTLHPEYRYLIGPVSISNRFSTMSKSLMVDFVQQHCFNPELACHVQARKQFRFQTLPSFPDKAALQNGVDSMEDLHHLIAGLEPGGIGVPVLLRHYIKQNARFIGFNVDPAFSNSLDGLVVVDAYALPERTHRLLERGTPRQPRR